MIHRSRVCVCVCVFGTLSRYGTFGARKCYKRSDDPLTLPAHLLHQPPRKAKVEEDAESREDRRTERAFTFIDFQFP